MYYLQSRYYDPEICRFINADSTDYLGATGTLLSYNLFAYCENDGVNFVDETGTTIKISNYSKDKNAKKAFKYIQKLTDDTLQYKDGKVKIKEKCAKKDIKKYYGTHLVRKLINLKFTVTIYVNDNKGGSYTAIKTNKAFVDYKKKKYVYGSGSSSTITLYLKDKSKSITTPIYIILAHELIHSYRAMKGMSIHPDTLCETHGYVMLEECIVVGLHDSGYKKPLQSIFTENNIRSENYLFKRKKY